MEFLKQKPLISIMRPIVLIAFEIFVLIFDTI